MLNKNRNIEDKYTATETTDEFFFILQLYIFNTNIYTFGKTVGVLCVSKYMFEATQAQSSMYCKLCCFENTGSWACKRMHIFN